MHEATPIGRQTSFRAPWTEQDRALDLPKRDMDRSRQGLQPLYAPPASPGCSHLTKRWDPMTSTPGPVKLNPPSSNPLRSTVVPARRDVQSNWPLA